jgi:lysozyme family protein
MKENFDKSFDLVICHEGGYVWDKDDPGGETNLGVTNAAWSEYLNRIVTHGEIKALTRDMVKPFYKKLYWDKVRGDELPMGVDYMVFDFAVNSGITQSSKTIQRCVDAVPDGIIGIKTLESIKKRNPHVIASEFRKAKETFYKNLVDQKPHLKKFLNGWMNRIVQVDVTVSSMID